MKGQNSKAKKDKINFIVPDFLNVDECVYLLDTFRSHKEIFKDNIDIVGLSGNFPGSIWNEIDKRFNRYKLSLENLKKLNSKYKSFEISLYIFFDKKEIKSKDLEDEYSNEIMKIFNDNNNYVICKSSKLKKYIMENYKKINIIDHYEENDRSGVYTLIHPNQNRNTSLFEDKDSNKYILYPDTNFIPNKKWLFKHTKKDSVLNKINPKKEVYYSKINSKSFYEVKKDNNFLSYEDLVEYSIKGINKFILSGFGVYNVAMIENIIDYLYKDKYKMDARFQIHAMFFKYKEMECNEIFNYRM